jgi:3-hydroxyacyl-CoA dehydrogenase/enoyl-CoA hydratase/carnithine racemase
MAADKMPCLHLSFPEPDIALLRPGLPDSGRDPSSQEWLEALHIQLQSLAMRADLTGLVLAIPETPLEASRPPRFEPPFPSPSQAGSPGDWADRGRAILSQLSEIAPITIAVIQGGCFGPNAEWALWCDRRVASSDAAARFGWPTIARDGTPAWGGTVRLPRIVGFQPAVRMLAQGQLLAPVEAARCGLFDELVTHEQLVPAAIARIRAESSGDAVREDRRRWAGPLPRTAQDESATQTLERDLQTGPDRFYPAPLAALKLLTTAAGKDAHTASRLETETFVQLQQHPVAAAIRHVRCLKAQHRRGPVDSPESSQASVSSVGLVGAGVMGIGIAATHLAAGFSVRVFDAASAALERGIMAIGREMDDEGSGSAVTSDTPPWPERLRPADSAESLTECDLILESVVETIEVKRRVYARIEPQLAPDKVLASNTSTIRITELARDLKHPDRFCGLHFFVPTRQRELVEIVRGPQTSPHTVGVVSRHVRRLGKIPIVVNDGPGFLVNRLLLPYMNESLELLCQGATIEQIDQAAEAFGMPLGPLALYDLIGIDTAFYGGRTLWEAFRDRVPLTPVLPAMFKRGRLGAKSGLGFYRHDGPQRLAPDPDVQPILEPYIRERHEFDETTLIERLWLPVLLEATRILADGIVQDVQDIDLAMHLGLAFPEFRGGLLYWADSLGTERILEMLQPYQALGPRFQPTERLLAMSQRGVRFYDAAVGL